MNKLALRKGLAFALVRTYEATNDEFIKHAAKSLGVPLTPELVHALSHESAVRAWWKPRVELTFWAFTAKLDCPLTSADFLPGCTSSRPTGSTNRIEYS